jgi:hypothetical protein
MGTRRLRLLLRAVRVLVACLVLGVVAAPWTAAAARLDTVVCVASPLRASSADSRRVAARSVVTRGSARAPAGIVSALLRDPRPALRLVARTPAGARDVVVRRRVYLHHAALLY